MGVPHLARAATAAALAGAALLTGCSEAPGEAPLYDEVVPAEVVMFAIFSGEAPAGAGSVLDDRNDVLGFAGRLAAHDDETALAIRELADGHDLGTTVLLAFTSGLGCSSADGVELRRSGDDFAFRYLDLVERDECYVPKGTVVVFALPKDQVRPGATVNGAPPDPAGLGELVAFEGVHRGLHDVTAAEVTQPDQAERFRAQFPDGLPALADALDPSPGNRLFAFPLNGCPGEESAVLVVAPDQLSAIPARGESVRCAAVEQYVAVFRVDAYDVPAQARIAAR